MRFEEICRPASRRRSDLSVSRRSRHYGDLSREGRRHRGDLSKLRRSRHRGDLIGEGKRHRGGSEVEFFASGTFDNGALPSSEFERRGKEREKFLIRENKEERAKLKIRFLGQQEWDVAEGDSQRERCL
ncbi:uncharacterized protein A4U43_C06F16600 [Asparagus officinalis]|uniref:Uncharacterized protein n=1 Tax=Asparagus officinalis TaxID=4686 RepID=A0A5P1EPT7_ASPOF|nr:uncharacterized protein A4U43_C06F16600 [Asparagus officinalis]